MSELWPSTRLIYIKCLERLVPSLLLHAILYTKRFRDNFKNSVFSEFFYKLIRITLQFVERYKVWVIMLICCINKTLPTWTWYLSCRCMWIQMARWTCFKQQSEHLDSRTLCANTSKEKRDEWGWWVGIL